MDELDRFDGPDRPEGFDGPEGRDLELVARLRTEPAPDDDTTARHHRQLVAAIQAAGAPAAVSTGTTAGPTTSVGTPSDNGAAPPPSPVAHDDDVDRGEEAPVVELDPLPGARRGRRRARHRLIATAAAVTVIAGGLVAVSRWASDGDDSTVAGPSPAEEPPPCGTELPFTFPVPAGFEGPLPGPSGEASDPYGPTDSLKLHWRSVEGDATIDVRWPSSLPMDPTTPVPGGVTDRMRYPSEETGDGDLLESFYSQAIGTGECSGLDVNVTSADAGANETILDQIGLALVGPGGPLASERPLVTGSTTADTLPTVEESSTCPGTEGGPVEGAPTYPTPREALGFYVATDTRFPADGYQEVGLPDGSFAYTYDAHAALQVPDSSYISNVAHVVPSGEGWRVASWESTRC